MKLTSWRSIFFIQMLGLSIFGNMVLSGMGSMVGFITIWAVLGFWAGMKFSFLSAVLNVQVWQGWIMQFYAFILPTWNKITQLEAFIHSGASKAQIQQYVNQNLPTAHYSIWMLIGEWTAIGIMIPLSIWIMIRRMKRIRRRIEVISSRLPK